MHIGCVGMEMLVKNIYLIQAGEKITAKQQTAYLPYAVGTIAAQAWSNELVKSAFSLQRIVFLREPINQVLNSLNNPFMVAFSCYIWNYEYNKVVAKEIKNKFSKCIVVFGGHSVPSGTSLLEECEYIDILIHGEGEEIFEKLLCSLAENTDLSEIPNISYRGINHNPLQNDHKLITGCNYPSPYKMGCFDNIIQENPDILFYGLLETNRGCPNNCAFCDWGPKKESVRMFSLERVKGDIDWFSDNKIVYSWIADANFGQFKRDLQITDWLIDAKKRSGYPNHIYINYTRHNDQNVFEMTTRFSQVDLSRSTTISMQTLSDEALNNIGRKNMTMKRFSELITLYKKAQIPTYSELILGLPGETYESFTNGIDKLLESGQHSAINVYDCVLLTNSILADKDYIKKHEIKAVRVPFVQEHSEILTDEITEYSNVVISTKSLPFEDWVKCKLFTFAVQSLHCLGLSRCFAVYLHNEKHIAYSDFYIKLLEWFFDHPSSLGWEVFDEILKRVQKMSSGTNVQYYHNDQFGKGRWFLEEGAFLSFISDIDRFYNEISVFLKTFGIKKDILEQLLEYQKISICIPGNKRSETMFDYDFYHYFVNSYNNDNSALKRIKHILKISSGDSFSDPKEYAREVLWYGRRLVKTLSTSNPTFVEIDIC